MPSTIHVVAVDDGYHSIKVVTANQQIRMPVSVARASHLTARALAPENNGHHRYEIAGVQYVVGPDIRDPIETRHNEYPYSAANLAVVTDALRRVIPAGETVRLITGVPFAHFFAAGGERRVADLARKVNALLRPVRDVTGAPLHRVATVNVVAQALAGWFDFVLDDQGRVNSERFDECSAVVDIGGRTIDVAVVQRGEVDLRLSGTQDLGTLDISAAVHRVIEEHIPGIPRRSHNFIERAIRRGVVRIGDREIDIRDVLERERTDLLDRITDYLAGLHGRYMNDIQRVLWIGGGSALLEAPLRKRFPKSEFLDDAQMSNARGMLKFERYSKTQEQEREQEALDLAE